MKNCIFDNVSQMQFFIFSWILSCTVAAHLDGKHINRFSETVYQSMCLTSRTNRYGAIRKNIPFFEPFGLLALGLFPFGLFPGVYRFFMAMLTNHFSCAFYIKPSKPMNCVMVHVLTNFLLPDISIDVFAFQLLPGGRLFRCSQDCLYLFPKAL